jgi:hypothetical protein
MRILRAGAGKEKMTTNADIARNHPITTSLEHLSKGVDRILKRWPDSDKPSKLLLLNDLAHAIRTGANWGALKSHTSSAKLDVKVDNASLIPSSPKDATVLPARLFQVQNSRNDISIYELAEDVRPLFGLRHNGDPIIGLELRVHEGNGYCDVSIFTRFILSRSEAVVVESVNAWEMEPDIAHLVFLAVQNLQHAAIYPTFGQADCGCLRIILGPYDVAAALPDTRYRGAKPDVPSQGVRILFDEHDIPSTTDINICLRLISASLMQLELETFPKDEPVQFRVSQPRMNVWKPVDFEAPKALDERTLFRDIDGLDWVHSGDFLRKKRISQYGKLGEALDLALALIDIDEPNLFLNVFLTPEPKREETGHAKAGSRGGIVAGWRVLRLLDGSEPQVLSLDAETQNRFEAGLNGWAIYEGYTVHEDAVEGAVEALVTREVRRASRHIEQVRALMNGTNPEDEEYLRTLKT